MERALSTVVILNTRTQKLNDISLRINGQTLDIVDSYKYLGVILDEKLSFQKHLYHIAIHINYKLRKLREIRSNIGNTTAVTIFKLLIKPHLDYCDIVWDAAGSCAKDKLQTIQEKALQIAYKGETDIEKLHTLTKILPISMRIEMHLVQHMYNIFKLPCPGFLSSTIKYVEHNYET